MSEATNDPALPEADVLVGPDAEGLLRAAYAMSGMDLYDATIRQVMYEPGASMSVRYAVTVAPTPAPIPASNPSGVAGSGAADGTGPHHATYQPGEVPADAIVETAVAAIDVDGPPEGSLVLTAGDLTVGVFRWPHDPGLPGLVAAADTAVRPEWWLPCGDDLELEVLTYRPGRRAVVHGRGVDGEVFVKVLTPRRAERVARRLDELRAAGLPVPRILDRTDSGVLVLEALPGTTMRDLMTDGRYDELPDPAELVELLDRFPQEWVGRTRTVDPPTFHTARHGRLVASVLPEVSSRIDTLVEQLEAVPVEPQVAVHGDFHDDQILVQDGRIVGLLDVDGSGTGALADDLGTFVGHLANRGLDLDHPEHDEYLDRVVAAFGARVGPEALAAQAAATVVGMATGPHRVQEDDWEQRTEDRVALAEQWARRAEGVSTQRSTDPAAVM